MHAHRTIYLKEVYAWTTNFTSIYMYLQATKWQQQPAGGRAERNVYVQPDLACDLFLRLDSRDKT